MTYDAKVYGARGPLSDPPLLGEYLVVLAVDAEAHEKAAKVYGARGPLSDPPLLGEYLVVLAVDAEAHEKAAVEAARIEWGEHIGRTQIRHVDDEPQRVREQAIRDAANEAALALMAMDGIEFTPEQHNSVIDAIHALLEES